MTALVLLFAFAAPVPMQGTSYRTPVAPLGPAAQPEDARSAPADAGAPPAARTSAQVLTTLKGVRPDMQACYEAAQAKNPGLAGTVVVAFTILADGSVRAASVKQTTLHHEGAERCVVERVEKLRFLPDPSGNAVALAYGWTFERTH